MTARLKNMMTVSGHDLDFPRSTFDSSLRMLFNNGGQWSIGTELLSLSVFEIFASKYICATTLTFQGHMTSPVTCPFDTEGAIFFNVRAPLYTSMYLQPLSR